MSSLGEDIVAAVTFRRADLLRLRICVIFWQIDIADFKVPRQILVLSEIPKGPSGKVQRSDLAERFGLGLRSSSAERPQRAAQQDGNLHQTVARIWGDVLRLDDVSSADNFFERGGDSIKLAQVVSRLRTELKKEISFRLLFESPRLDVFTKELGKLFSEDGDTEGVSDLPQ